VTRFDQIDYYGRMPYARRTIACSITVRGDNIGIHPKIGITGLPRSGKSAVLQKVVDMVTEERERELRSRSGDGTGKRIVGGMKTRTILEDGQRVGFECVDIITGESAVMAHRDIDSRTRILGFGIAPEALDEIGVEAISRATDECEILVIDEIGKYSVESEAFVKAVREGLDEDMPTILTLHKKSRHPLLQDIRRRDDARILEVTPVNRALLPYKIHKLVRETY
jgi:nucleoside-triphosphatase|tara:strand:- start:2280 stop:2954 length:675 start_codon:yes stop_codon:yes gene_type:complete